MSLRGGSFSQAQEAGRQDAEGPGTRESQEGSLVEAKGCADQGPGTRRVMVLRRDTALCEGAPARAPRS